jgi:hypothetical protein
MDAQLTMYPNHERFLSVASSCSYLKHEAEESNMLIHILQRMACTHVRTLWWRCSYKTWVNALEIRSDRCVQYEGAETTKF